MPTRKSIIALIHLSRYHDYLLFVTINSLLGFHFSNAQLTQQTVIKFAVVLLANFLAVCFSFMINDVEDAEDDALNPDKVNRNPISAGRLSRRRALAATILVAVASSITYLYLGAFIGILGGLMLIIGGMYSWKLIRLKNIPIIDIVSHSQMLGGLLFLTSYFTFVPFQGFSAQWLIPLIFISCISAYGELFNEIRDLTYDKKAGLTHTAAFIGKAQAEKVMYGFLFAGFITLILGIMIGLIPLWIMGSTLILTIIFSLPILFYQGSVVHMKKKEKLQESIMLAGLVTIILWVTLHSLTI